MFNFNVSKEVANRILAQFISDYGRLSILSNWKLNIKKICDIKPISFLPNQKLIVLFYIFIQRKNL